MITPQLRLVGCGLGSDVEAHAPKAGAIALSTPQRQSLRLRLPQSLLRRHRRHWRRCGSCRRIRVHTQLSLVKGERKVCALYGLGTMLHTPLTHHDSGLAHSAIILFAFFAFFRLLHDDAPSLGSYLSTSSSLHPNSSSVRMPQQSSRGRAMPRGLPPNSLISCPSIAATRAWPRCQLPAW